MDQNAKLDDHMANEEEFQREVAGSLKETAVAMATVASRLEYNEKAHHALLGGLSELDGKLDDYERRLISIECSVAQAATVAKWFFGGGFVAAIGALLAVLHLVQQLHTIIGTKP